MLARLLQGWSRRWTERSRGDRGEAGDTLLEVLIALFVLALASVALITAFETSINASAVHRNLANFDTVLASSISTTTSVIQQQTPGVFSTCDPLSGYPSSAELTSALNLAGYTAAIAPSGSQPAVEYLSDGSYSTSCATGTNGDVSNPQLINVVVTDTATGMTQSDTVVVDDPTVIQTTGATGSTANELVFITQPEGATIGNPFATQPVLEVEDNGAIVTSDLSPITLTIGTGPGGAALSSTCSGEETAGIVTYTGCSINEVGTGYELYASEPDPSNPGLDLTASSAPFSVYASQLDTPTITAVTPSTTTLGIISVTFTAPANAPNGQTYSVKACQDSAMSVGCVIQNNFVSGSAVTGLTSGSSYYFEITAAASTDYLGSTSPPAGPALATVQLKAPTVAPTLAYGPTSGSLTVVSFGGSSNAPPSQTYTAVACTNTNMSSGCQSNANIAPGGSVTGLMAGTTYYVWITANASPGYLASTHSPLSVAQQATNAVKTPNVTSVTPSLTTAGVITFSFTEPNGTQAPSSYTATACTDAAMSQNCVTASTSPPGGQITGLNPGTSYYVTVTAVSTATGFASATSSPSSPTLATVQLAAPTAVSVGYGATAGSVSVTFSGSSNAAPGQVYSEKICPNSAMTGCTTNANFASGSSNNGLTYTVGSVGNTYYVQITASASAGYLVSPASTTASGPDTSQVAATGTPTASAGTGAKSLLITFNSSPGIMPSSYTVLACTNIGMSQGCVTQTNVVSGVQFTNNNLQQNRTYYVEVTAVGPAGYVDSTASARSNGATVT